jgi:hypothetical protein
MCYSTQQLFGAPRSLILLPRRSVYCAVRTESLSIIQLSCIVMTVKRRDAFALPVVVVGHQVAN